MNKFILWLLFTPLLLSCESKHQKGKRLAQQYCGSCHAFPEPGLLPKTIWQNKVLPNMALRMGLLDLMESTQYTSSDDFLAVVSTIPNSPMVSKKEWQAIVDYFVKAAPDFLENPKLNDLPTTNIFNTKSYHDTVELVPLVTLIRFDSISQRIFFSNRNGILNELTFDFEKISTHQLSSPASHLVRFKDDYLILLMGIMDPNDQPKGELTKLNADNKFEPLIDSLKRPVYFEAADLNRVCL